MKVRRNWTYAFLFIFVIMIIWSATRSSYETFNVFDGMIKATTASVPTLSHKPMPIIGKIANILPNTPILTRGPIVDTKNYTHYEPELIGPMIHVDRNPLYPFDKNNS